MNKCSKNDHAKEITRMPTVVVPSPLRRYTKGQSRVQVDGSTVGEAIDNLEQQHPGVKPRLCDASGHIKRYINVFVNGEEIRALQGAGTVLEEKDEVSIVPAMAGGTTQSCTGEELRS
jgi:molybdopterin synthase sulfur carrier subunit